ncbi:hypothetical protein MITS9509_00987 [Synechococcus sp. MIT S9509]|uniref:hypothetical protein n=1 Tax=Synechococcus sp. MIT S9509 TaxID=1801630 RepID=UPI0007BAFB64|nr:hypothetical protein [Synechococcus sp. MIT S9509]KZR93110.1 hypothetical protein MITS9509_00987 [Synechococcus sp. MIT S9509]
MQSPPDALQEGWTVKLTCHASYDIEPKTATENGVIQLDGLVKKIDGNLITVMIYWMQPSGWGNLKHRSTPVVATGYPLTRSQIDGLAGHPPTMWDQRTTESLKESVVRTQRQHLKVTAPESAWWTDIGEL